jgi:hypothetical protein
MVRLQDTDGIEVAQDHYAKLVMIVACLDLTWSIPFQPSTRNSHEVGVFTKPPIAKYKRLIVL